MQQSDLADLDRSAKGTFAGLLQELLQKELLQILQQYLAGEAILCPISGSCRVKNQTM